MLKNVVTIALGVVLGTMVLVPVWFLVMPLYMEYLISTMQ
jgi:hypothetical protein